MKATASKSAKNTQPTVAVAKGRVSPAGKKPTAAPGAKASSAVKTVATKTPPAKNPPAVKAAAKAGTPNAAKTAAPAAAKRTTPSLPAPAAKKVPVTPTTTPLKKTAVAPKKSATSSKKSSASAPIVIEPTPKPLGKRAAKKVMMEQMTQAAVVPTHAPDAAKATFSTMNERVMTPPVPSSIQKDPKRANNWKTLAVEQLTDLDVQAMPDGEYMNDVQLAFFRRKLSLLRADMLANAGETTEHLREDTVVVPDPADRATIEEEHALELRTRDRERKLLKKIQQAITRIDTGDYGFCEETGEAIGVARLMARPTASLSLEAQQRRELKQKMFGD
ncbi:RNA polymerase-binding protein DksA [Hydrogenophaga sp. PAMC20947]|uniref:RNA polymerase-binding protein DksA n=1 Tax=Hydrogenophaga sp. PAMC20947 TaxID=2565558 RepID=UPI00109D8966|nr:RNA polymerase-binding protein DksA [Hydrogenophaga sp. PAMC20947]QCB48173.1 RNA polymerase-binding protein DksA [Hydrogenophaga sp. PAMC20947]